MNKSALNASYEIDKLIEQNQDWRGAMLAEIRKIILETDPEIVEEWKYKGSPVWSKGGIICIGNLFKNKVQLVFNDGAALNDPDRLFSSSLGGSKWRYIDIFEGDKIEANSLKNLVRAATIYNQTKEKN